VVAADIKVPFAAFFAEGGRDAEERPSEAPLNMLAAMGLAALICLAIGVYPAALYRRLPFPTEYAPFTLSHVHAQLQLLAFAALAFVLFRRRGWMTAPAVTTVVDVDWLYRRLPGIVWAKALRPAQSFTDHGKKALVALTRQVPRRVPEYRGVKSSAVWILGLLTFVLFLTFWYFLRS
jgi:multicomponent Na+:H+ antiporter subunit D